MSIRDYQTLYLRHQFVIVRKDMNVNEHERLFNIKLRHKFKQRNRTFIITVLHFTVTTGSSTMSKTHTLK